MKKRVYVDTSVFGGCGEPEFSDASRRLMDSFIRGENTAIVSAMTVVELMVAPDPIRALLASVPRAHLEMPEVTEEIEILANAYLDHRVIGAAHRADALHIATASVVRADVLVSWNFKHIVNLQRIHGYNSVNLRSGYPLLEIRSPLEVAGDD